MLTEHCAYGETLEEILRDRLICGISNAAIRRCLLAELDLTLSKAISVAQAAKIADADVKELQSSIAGATLASTTYDNYVYKCISECSARTKDNANKGADCCHRDAKHNPDQWCFKLGRCHVCGKLGHIAKVCQPKKISNFRQW